MSSLPPSIPRFVPGTLTVAASVLLAWVLMSFGSLAAAVLFLIYLAAASAVWRVRRRRRPRAAEFIRILPAEPIDDLRSNALVKDARGLEPIRPLGAVVPRPLDGHRVRLDVSIAAERAGHHTVERDRLARPHLPS